MECRLCMSSVPEPTILIFDARHSFALRIWSCCQLQVEENDGLPDKICIACATKLESYEAFKNVCKQTDKFFKERLTANNFIKKEDVLEYDDFHEYPFAADDDSVNFKDIPIAKSNENEQDTKLTEIEVTWCEYPEDVVVNSKNTSDIPVLIIDKQDVTTLEEKKGKYKCEVCGKHLMTAHTLKSHNLIHSRGKTRSLDDLTRKRHECVKCNKLLSSKSSLDRHMLRHSRNKDVRVKKNQLVECHICKVLVNKHRFPRHIGRHNKSTKVHSCDLCGKRFEYPNTLKKHVTVVHLKIKSHQCSICGKLLATKKTHNSHMKIHLDHWDYVCDYCGKKFKYRTSIISHIWTHTGEKPYKCQFCSRHFISRGILNSHILQHTGENPFKCTICLKGFKQRCNLKSHMRHFHKKA